MTRITSELPLAEENEGLTRGTVANFTNVTVAYVIAMGIVLWVGYDWISWATCGLTATVLFTFAAMILNGQKEFSATWGYKFVEHSTYGLTILALCCIAFALLMSVGF